MLRNDKKIVRYRIGGIFISSKRKAICLTFVSKNKEIEIKEITHSDKTIMEVVVAAGKI